MYLQIKGLVQYNSPCSLEKRHVLLRTGRISQMLPSAHLYGIASLLDSLEHAVGPKLSGRIFVEGCKVTTQHR